MARFAPSELSQLRVVRELGARTPGTYLAEREGERFVLETYANLPPKTVRQIDASARRIEAVVHPHVMAVLAVERIGGGVCVLSEWVEGVPVSEVFFDLDLGARLRILVDILGALSALHHAPGDGPLVHAGVLATSAFITRAGLTKLGFAYRAPLCLRRDAVAPESLLADEADLGPHTDVYSAGVMLWEAISGRSLFGDEPPERIIAAQLANRVPPAELPEEAGWAASLLPVLERALAIDPSRRFPDVAAMAGELRLAARAHVAMHAAVAKQVFALPPSGIQPVHRDALPVAAAAQSETRVLAAEPFLESEPPPSIPISVEVEPPPASPPPSPVPERVGAERPKRRLLRWGVLAAGAAAVALVAGLGLLSRRSPVPHAIAHDAEPPSVAAKSPAAPPVPAERETVSPAAPLPAAAPRPPAASSGSAAPARPRPRHNRGGPYNPSTI